MTDRPQDGEGNTIWERLRRRKVVQWGIAYAAGAWGFMQGLAYVSELIDPVSIFLGLTRRNLMSHALRFLIWGEGETGLLVYSILLRDWEWTPDGDVRPRIFLMSD